jgi:hypothetical protein
MSRTSTENEQRPVLEAVSTAVQFTVVMPGLKSAPLGGEQIATRLVAQLSIAETAKFTGTPAAPPHETNRLLEHATTGAVVSTTRTANEHEFVLPAASSATHNTWVTPGAKIEPLAGKHAMETLVEQLSIALTS